MKGKPGRPPGSNYPAVIRVRLSLEDRAKFDAQAISENLTLSNWVRKTLGQSCAVVMRPHIGHMTIEKYAVIDTERGAVDFVCDAPSANGAMAVAMDALGYKGTTPLNWSAHLLTDLTAELYTTAVEWMRDAVTVVGRPAR